MIDSVSVTTIHAAVAEDRRFHVEYRIQHADGRARWVWEHGGGVRDASGRVVAIEGIVEDITARVESEQALREAERRYRSLFDNAIEGIFRTTPEGRYLDANPALARIYGFATSAGARRIAARHQEPALRRRRRREEFMRIIKTRGEISGFESRVYRKNGDVIWISENARAVFDDEGRVLHYEGTVEDITERRQNQARIEQQANYDSLTGLANRSLLNDRLQQAIYSAASYGARLAVVFVDLDRFKYINDTLGHDVGDRLLQVMAERFTSAVAATIPWRASAATSSCCSCTAKLGRIRSRRSSNGCCRRSRRRCVMGRAISRSRAASVWRSIPTTAATLRRC